MRLAVDEDQSERGYSLVGVLAAHGLQSAVGGTDQHGLEAPRHGGHLLHPVPRVVLQHGGLEEGGTDGGGERESTI